MTQIIATVITGLVTLAGIIVSAIVTSNKTQAEMDKKQAVTDTKIEELVREVREHNNFARRMPVVEEKISALERRMSAVEDA